MLASFYSWWFARIVELLPRSWMRSVGGALDGVVIDVDRQNNLTASVRRTGERQIITLGVAARLAGRKPVLLRPPPESVLEKHHVVPVAPRRELDQLLRYELQRITPFRAQDLFWRWDARPKPGDKSRMDVTLTLVIKAAIDPALAMLANIGIQPRFIAVGPTERPRLLAIEDEAGRTGGYSWLRGLAWTCAGLAVIALVLPVLLQELALHGTETAIDALQPTIKQVEELRRGITAGDAGRDILARESERTGDVLQILAMVTRILPDDTFLTDFSLRERQMTLSGRSASAPRLISGLSADPAIRNIAFAAPVTRIEGSTMDVFSIKSEVAR